MALTYAKEKAKMPIATRPIKNTLQIYDILNVVNSCIYYMLLLLLLNIWHMYLWYSLIIK